MREILKDIFINEVKLKMKDPPFLNLMVVKASPRSLLFDTGVTKVASESCAQALYDMLESLGIEIKDLDCFISHAHPDHIGLAKELSEKGATIYANADEMKAWDSLIYYQVADEKKRERLFQNVGLERKKLPAVYEKMSETAMREFFNMPFANFEFTPIRPGDMLSYGEYHFQVVSLSGHTKYQMGLMDEEKKLIFCADHIMQRIVPIVGAIDDGENALECYFQTMRFLKEKCRGFLFIPCHGEEFRDLEIEADRIINHYLSKCQLMIDLLRKKGEKMTIRDIGTTIYGRDREHPDMKKFSSCLLIWAKTYACLLYMRNLGFVLEEEVDGVRYWFYNKNDNGTK